MARQQPGETKAPLVIALAFFVLTSLGLGVLAGHGQLDLEAADAAVAEAKKEDAAVKLAETADAKAKLYKVAVGTGNDQDWTDLEDPQA